MHAECILINSVNFKHCSNDLEVTLLNIRSFNKRAIDLGSDERLTTSDIVWLTQTQLQPSAETKSVLPLEEFKMVYNNNTDQFQSITMYSKYHYISQTKINGASYIELKK